MTNAQTTAEFLLYAEKLKTELRRASKSNGMRESVAEHCWSLCLLLILVAPHLSVVLDLLRALKMAVIHDLVEIEANDISILHVIADPTGVDTKYAKELAAMEKMRPMLGLVGDEIYDLWIEFEEATSIEARVVKALDRIEGQAQFLADPVERFGPEEKGHIEELISTTEDLASIDPYVAEVYRILLPALRQRVNPEYGRAE
jgi:putative hydrolase of HD superfamily